MARAPRQPLRLFLHQQVYANDAQYKLNAAFHGQFFEDAIDVSANGFRTASELPGDVAARVVFENELGDLEFADRQAHDARNVVPVRRGQEVFARIERIEEVVGFFRRAYDMVHGNSASACIFRAAWRDRSRDLAVNSPAHSLTLKHFSTYPERCPIGKR
jgi:hypothetical protein